MDPDEVIQMFQKHGFLNPGYLGFYAVSSSPKPTPLKSKETNMTAYMNWLDKQAVTIATRLLQEGSPITLPHSVTREGYLEFVDQTVIRPTDPGDLELYLHFGLQAEIGEVRQVICKSLRPGYDQGKAANDLLSELSDCLYWHTAVSLLGYSPYPDPVYEECVEILGKDLLREINYCKLMDRRNQTGSFTK